MSGRRAPHLQRRNGIYYLRVRVPDAVRPLLGRSEVRRTLGTSDIVKARSLAARFAAKVMEALDVIVTNRLTRDQAQKIVQGCFAELVEATEASPVIFGHIDKLDLALVEQHGLSAERVRDLREQLLGSVFDGTVAFKSSEAAAAQGSSWANMAEQNRLNLMSGIARALVEQQRLFQLRLTDRLARFTPQDDLFSSAGPAVAAPILAAPVPIVATGATVEVAIRNYLEAGRQQWVRKTYDARRWQLGFFAQHVDPGLPLAAVTVMHVRTFRDALRSLHKRHGKMKGASFIQRQTSNVDHRIADKTASIIFDGFKAFMRWAKSIEGLIDNNPAEDIRFPATKKTKGIKSRRSYTASELVTLFTSPIHTGCQSVHRRYATGPRIIKDAKFWIPILGYYTGARLGELIQLHVADVDVTGAIPLISFTEMNLTGSNVGDRKHLKTAAAVRQVPLHPDVMELGFAEFVTRRGTQKGRSRVRLFDEFPYGSDDQASTVASKWFARFMDKVGLPDPAIVFHSFRHTAEDAFKDALVPQYVTDKIIGHSDGATSSQYGEGVSLEVMYEAVKKMHLKVRLPCLLVSSN